MFMIYPYYSYLWRDCNLKPNWSDGVYYCFLSLPFHTRLMYWFVKIAEIWPHADWPPPPLRTFEILHCRFFFVCFRASTPNWPVQGSMFKFYFLQADFLKGLPVYNKSNFSRFHADSVCKASVSLHILKLFGGGGGSVLRTCKMSLITRPGLFYWLTVSLKWSRYLSQGDY